jgi:hypothetical protein
MKTKLTLFLFASVALFFASCTKYPPTSDRLLEDLAIVTQYDTKVDFNIYKTFSIVPYIKKITDTETTDITNDDVLNQISKNMEARGFVKVAANTKADFEIQVVYFQNTTVYTYYYDYWGYYPGYYYYYPYYPVYYGSYTTGLADIQLFDTKVAPERGSTLAIRWNAYIRGLLTGSHSQQEILNSIDQAFIQTPQLTTSAK